MKKGALHFTILFGVILMILSSCSTSNHVVSGNRIQKRKYTKGFSISRSGSSEFSKTLNKTTLKQRAATKTLKEERITKSPTKRIDDELIFEQEKNDSQVKLIEIRSPFLKRSKMNKILSMSQIFVQKFVQNVKEPENSVDINESPKKIDFLSIFGFILGGIAILLIGRFIVFGAILGPFALIFSAVGLSSTKSMNRSGAFFAIIGIICGALACLALFLLVL